MPQSRIAPLLDFLKDRHARIMACEKNAFAALRENQDQEAYADLMHSKARLLAALDEDAAELARELPAPLRENVENRLRGFAQSARNGLSIGSVFYYSALLYPDEHQPGEPDNLALFIEELEQF